MAPADPTQNVAVPTPDYLIGPSDVLTVLFWDSPEMSAEVLVRPDGQISLPLLDDVQAAGLTPEQLRDDVSTRAARFIADPTVTITVREINSRLVYILGQVGRPGGYPLAAPMTVLHLLALGGGLSDFARANDIIVLRTSDAGTTTLEFNYEDVTEKHDVTQNVLLLPGDTVIVP